MPVNGFSWKNHQRSQIWSSFSGFFFKSLRFSFNVWRSQTLTWGLIGKGGGGVPGLAVGTVHVLLDGPLYIYELISGWLPGRIFGQHLIKIEMYIIRQRIWRWFRKSHFQNFSLIRWIYIKFSNFQTAFAIRKWRRKIQKISSSDSTDFYPFSVKFSTDATFWAKITNFLDVVQTFRPILLKI